ncbi:steroid receptor RNA activator 1 [Cynoglossus semilaevis]|uniref:steroid receptor RNA activator 1 n=1 Tax=Cynoglossus semilaevis TaxID=244447 RepID=UPI00049500E4|nr:steroid receptor RNA activator 1 [Cynoglossus semilaevis]
MEDMYVKPGNQERGWNDPPQFSYGLQMSRTPQRTLLNKRAAPPVSGAPPPVSVPSNPLAPPPCAVATPPVHPVQQPPGFMATPPPPAGPIRSQKEADRSQSERTPEMEAVMSVMKSALMSCRQTVKGQICNDVEKRLRLLEDSWTSGRLSLPVQRRMDTLAEELKSGRWDAADEIHRSLMVDHVTEVSQWMVGVKRLIAETRNLSPQHLELFLSPEVPEQEPPDEADEEPCGPSLDSSAG